MEICAREIAARGFDVLFANTCFFYQAPRIGRHVTGPKLLYLQEPIRTLHEWRPRSPWPAPLPEDTWSQRLQDPVRTFLLRRVAREEVLNARAYDQILCNLYYSRESIARSYGSERACLLPRCGCKAVPSRSLHSHGKIRRSLASGPFTRQKTRSWRSVQWRPSRCRGRAYCGSEISRNGLYEAEMRALAGSVDVELEIKVLVSDEELIRSLGSAAVLLYTPHLEPFGYAPIEANACGFQSSQSLRGAHAKLSSMENRHSDGARRIGARCRSPVDPQRPDRANLMGQQGAQNAEKAWNNEAAIERLEGELFRLLDR